MNIHILGISILNSLPGILSPGSTARKSSLENYVKNVKPLVDAVLKTQAGLTDTTKVQAELFNDKPKSFLPAIAKLIDVPLNNLPLSYDNYVVAAFAGTVAAWDAAILGFKNKIYWNSVRPVTAIRYLYNKSNITTWVKGKGTVSNVPGIDFLPYIKTPAHTDYPSTSAIYFAAFAAAEKAFFGKDNFGWSYTYAAGKSAVEPGQTPASPVTITANTFTEYANLGGQARFVGGGMYLHGTIFISINSND